MVYANGIVKDTKTGLMWKVGPDRDTDWNEARSWVQSLGDDWRMPAMEELKGLYRKGKGSMNMTPLLKASPCFVWSGETKGSSHVWDFNFVFGGGNWHVRNDTSCGFCSTFPGRWMIWLFVPKGYTGNIIPMSVNGDLRTFRTGEVTGGMR